MIFTATADTLNQLHWEYQGITPQQAYSHVTEWECDGPGEYAGATTLPGDVRISAAYGPDCVFVAVMLPPHP